MIKTVLLDIDDTILDFKACAEAAVCKASKEYKFVFTFDMFHYYLNVNEKLWNKYENGSIAKNTIFAKRFKTVFDTFNINMDGMEFENKFQQYFQNEYIFIEGAEEIIKYLSSKYNIYAASNSLYESQKSRLTKAGIIGYFKDLFISDKIGAQKPQSEFFEYCFKNIPGFNRDETIIIGDSLSSDIQGANNSGIKSCWFNSSNIRERKYLKYDYKITSLSQIKDIL